MGRRLLLVVLVWCALASPFRAARGDAAPIVVLVSFDGWRWDYIDRANVPNLRALAARGVRAKGLIPSSPPKTFPNHYTIVTGLYPDHHGIVSNTMVDSAIGERFTMSAATALDPRWWGGEPLWLTAMRQGKLAASMFWPGSEVRGRQPTYWKPFDDKVPNAARVQQVLEWLALPEGERPSFVTLYFSEVDHAGHDYGPDSPEVLAAAAHLDAALGDLIAGIERLHLLGQTSVVVVSDHGMSQMSDRRIIFLDDYLDLSTVEVIDTSPSVGLVPRSGSVDAVYLALKGKHPALAVYRREQLPARLHYGANPRVPPIVGIARDGWRITSHAQLAKDRAAGKLIGGEHGYDTKNRSMQGLFVAAGPKIRPGVVVPSFENIHIYDFLCELLDVTPAANDGDPRVMRGFLAK